MDNKCTMLLKVYFLSLFKSKGNLVIEIEKNSKTIIFKIVIYAWDYAVEIKEDL